MGFLGNQVLKDRKKKIGDVQAGIGIKLQEHGNHQGGMKDTETRGRAGFQVKASWVLRGCKMEKSLVPRSPLRVMETWGRGRPGLCGGREKVPWQG